MSRNIAHFATIGIPIISKMHREMSGEREPGGRRQPDCHSCQGKPLRSDCRVRVAMCADASTGYFENRFSVRICSLQSAHSLFAVRRECFDLFLPLCNRSLEVKHFVLFLDERLCFFRNSLSNIAFTAV